jgi:D-alanine-D-alanine ligase
VIIAVLHAQVGPEAPADEQDVLTEVETVLAALSALGHQAVRIEFTLNLEEVTKRLLTHEPEIVFNLVESVAGRGRLIHLAPSLLDHLGIPYTGNATEPVICTSNKLLGKKILQGAGIATPAWLTAGCTLPDSKAFCPCIVKSVWEHASIGIGPESVIQDCETAKAQLSQLSPDHFAERFIEGREFNLALLSGNAAPGLLPIAEIVFEDYPPGKPRIVDYRAKWVEDSFEYRSTIRRFDFPASDGPLLQRMEAIARHCWECFDLRGYARVDFRVDREGLPWVLEVNTNPCLSPDAGFMASAKRTGLTVENVVAILIQDALQEGPGGIRRRSAATHHQAPLAGYREVVRESDEEQVRRLVESTGFFSSEEAGIAAELVEERRQRGEESGYHFLFQDGGEELKAYTCFGPIPATVSGYDLYWIAVHQQQRGRGLGKAILAETERRIAELGGREIYAETSSRSQYAPTRRFYESSGYIQAAFLDDFYAPGDSKVIYRKKL